MTLNNTEYKRAYIYDIGTDTHAKRETILKDVQKTYPIVVVFDNSYKNILTYVSMDKKLLICVEDYRYGFNLAHSLEDLIDYTDKFTIWEQV